MKDKFCFSFVLFCYLLTNVGCIEAQKREASKTAAPTPEIATKLEQERIAAENLIYDAQGQQAEIAADALIRIVESNKIITVQRKIELLEEAFRRASEAQHPVRLGFSGVTDTRSGMLSEALDLELDKLSLQSRAVMAMLPLDKKRAKELFNEIPPKLTFTPTGCKEGFIFPVVDNFYETLEAVLGKAFTEKEKKQNAHIYYTLPYIESLSSPAQVAPTLKMILSLKPNQNQLLILGGALTRALKNAASDDHSFRESMTGNKATLQIINLRKAYQNKQLPDQEITDVFRSYLLKQLNGTRCSDGLKINNQTPSDSKYLLPVYIEYVNVNLLTGNPITAEQIEPFKIENAEDSPDYYPDLSEETRLRKYQKLRFNSEGKEVSESEKNQDEWQIGFSQLLNDVVSWNPKDNASNIDFFHQKCAFFQSMLEIVPKQKLELQENAFNQYLYFVANSQMQRENRAEWLMQAQRLLNLVAASSAEVKAGRQEAVEKTNNTTLSLYLKLKIPVKTAVEQISYERSSQAQNLTSPPIPVECGGLIFICAGWRFKLLKRTVWFNYSCR